MTPGIYQHKEAYCVMTYANEDRSVVEQIWNARDGVTPFLVSSQDGAHELQHVDWQNDRFTIGYIPKVGSRIFVDLTMDAARAYRRTFVAKYWDVDNHGYVMSEQTDRWLTQEEAVERLAKGDFEQGGEPGKQPDVVVVTEFLHNLYIERSAIVLRILIPNPRFA